LESSILRAREKSNPHAGLMIVNGIGNNKNRLSIDFYKSYTAYVEVIKKVKGFPFINVDSIDSFLVNLKDETNLRVLSTSAIAKHLEERSQNKL
jgi:hypothetical protein